MSAAHEQIVAVADEGVRTSERTFGLVMAGAFAVLAAINFWHSGRVWPALTGVAVVFAAVALIWPPALRPLNVLWHKLGLLLHAVVTPVIMGLIFFTAVTVTGVAMRLFGKNPLRLKRPEGLESYWIVRAPPGPEPRSLKDQF